MLKIEEATIQIPGSSRLLLQRLAQSLQIDIYIFSSRAQARVYATTNPQGAMENSWCSALPESLFSRHWSHNQPSPPTTVQPAVFRETGRKRTLGQRGLGSELSRENAQNHLGASCLETMHEEIKTAVDTVSRKTLKARDELKRSLMGFKRLPTGVLQRALDKARTNLDLGESYSLKHFQTRLGIRKDENIRIWLHDVESRFLDAWDEELSRDGSDRPAKRQRTTEDPTEAHQTRTCTPLRQIIRPELQNHHDSIVAIADNCQEEITDTLDELSVLTLKATMAIASGAVHGTEESFFDIRAILPANFEFRDDVNPVLNVATLPSNLQEQIADMIELNTAKQDDTYSLLSQHHLQHMHNQFMGPQKSNNVTAGEQAEEPGQDRHPRWEKITRAINPSTNLSAISTFPAGLSSTMTAQIREYATAVTNLWQGSIHTKLIGYTLRVLLRLHLAPKREQKQHSRQATQDDRQNSNEESPSITRKQCHSRIKSLCDELADCIQGKHNGQDRSPNSPHESNLRPTLSFRND